MDQPPNRLRTQLSQFFYRHAAFADVAIELLDPIAERLFTPQDCIAVAHKTLAELRWRLIDKDQLYDRLAGFSRVTIDLMLRSVFEALHTRLRCEHSIEVTSAYHFNIEFRTVMLRYGAFRSWLARDFFRLEDASPRFASPFVSDLVSTLDRELRRLGKVGYLAGDVSRARPYAIHLHKVFPHFGFLVVEFPGRTEVLELNQVTETYVGDFAYSDHRLVRARFLPEPRGSAEQSETISEIARRETKTLTARLVQHLFLATDESERTIDQILEQVFVCNFLRSADRESPIGRATLSPFERRRWFVGLDGPRRHSETRGAMFGPDDEVIPELWLEVHGEMEDHPAISAAVVRPSDGGGVRWASHACRELYLERILPARRVLLSWQAERVLATYTLEGLPEPGRPASLAVRTRVLVRRDSTDDRVNIVQIDRLTGVADMITETVMIREPEGQTLRIIVVGRVWIEDDLATTVDLFPLEVRLPSNS